MSELSAKDATLRERILKKTTGAHEAQLQSFCLQFADQLNLFFC